MEASLAAYSGANLFGQSEATRPTLGGIHPSYSTNDVPTLKNAHGSSTDIAPSKTHAQQQFHNHNASLGRIPPSAVHVRHSRELSGGDYRREEQTGVFQQMSSALQASAAPFGPSASATSPIDSTPGQMIPFANAINFQGQPFYGPYNTQVMSSMQQMGSPMAFQNQVQMFQPQQNGGFSQYPANYAQQARFPDSQARMMQQRRTTNGDGEFRTYFSIVASAK